MGNSRFIALREQCGKYLISKRIKPFRVGMFLHFGFTTDKIDSMSGDKIVRDYRLAYNIHKKRLKAGDSKKEYATYFKERILQKISDQSNR
jgi:hypothetical protein